MKVRMTVSLDEQLVDKLSEVAKRNGLSNSGVLNLCLRYALPRLESGHLLDTSRQEPRSLSVLLVEDMELDAQLVIQTLRRGDYEPKFEVVQTEKEMSTALQKGGWDVVLSDWALPDFSGIEALRLHKNSGLKIPFIIVSGRIGEEAAVAAMRAGADDYILKDHLEKLVPGIKRALAAHAEASNTITNSRQQRERAPRKRKSRKDTVVTSSSRSS
jgi:DNA-binding NtrC family response regulator